MNAAFFNTKNFDSNQFTTAWSYLTDNEGQPCFGKINLSDWQIECISTEKHFSLNALIEVPNFGKVVLRTATIHANGSKYDLLEELIKGRVQQIENELNKINEEFKTKFENELITLKRQLNSKKKLSKLMKLGESIIVENSKNKLKEEVRIGKTKDLLLGCQNFGIEKSKKYRKIHEELFDLGIAPLYLFLLKPDSRDKTDWFLTDKIVNWLSKSLKVIKGHPLVWLHKYARPHWMLDLNFEELKDFLSDHITSVVNRYRRKIRMWDIVNEIPSSDANGFDLTIDQLLEITKLTSDLVKKIQPEAERIINFSEIFGAQSFVHEKPSIPPLHFLRLCVKKNIEFEGIGLQFYMGMKKEFTCRELLDISQTVDEFTKFGKSIHFSELDWPSKHDVDPDCFFSSDHPEVGGWWHRRWDEKLQADFLEKIYTLFASKQNVKSITWWDLTDNGKNEDIGSRFLPFGGLTRRDFSPKPVLIKLKKFQKLLKKF